MRNAVKEAAGALTVALMWPAGSALADPLETFESHAPGTAVVHPFYNDPTLGILSGGAVAAPGSDISNWFQINGAQVYAGTSVTYTTYYGPLPEHCCGYFYLDMLLSSPTGVTVEFWGHGADFDYGSIALMWSTVVTGQSVFLSFGDPWDGQAGDVPGNSDIVEVRFYTADGSLFALDDFRAMGTPAIPEPASWAMMLAGFGLVGMAARRRRPLPA